MQFDLDFSGSLPPSAQLGMAKANDNADPKWRHVFDACVLAASKKKPEITSDDVLTELETLPNAPSTHNLAAIGPAMKRAAEKGVLRSTERWVRSQRPEKNGNLHRVWESVYFAPF